MYDSLEARWLFFTQALRIGTEASDPVFEVLKEAYTAPTRKYHSFSHIEACLDVLSRHVPYERHMFNCLFMAIFWHDFEYVPTRSDNEEKSAFAFVKYARKMGLDEKFIGEVADMIPYTKHSAQLTGMADRYKYLVDVDLSILGEDEKTFDAYEDGVRFEYAFVPQELFNAGRAKILREFLNRPFIYETEPFRQEYEGRARANLTRSIAKLTGA